MLRDLDQVEVQAFQKPSLRKAMYTQENDTAGRVTETLEAAMTSTKSISHCYWDLGSNIDWAIIVIRTACLSDLLLAMTRV